MATTTAPGTTTTARRTCRYTEGQAVEVQVHDFAAPGMPLVWVRATVTEVTEYNARLWDVAMVTVEDQPKRELVGPRGGNPRLREARVLEEPPTEAELAETAEALAFLRDLLA